MGRYRTSADAWHPSQDGGTPGHRLGHRAPRYPIRRCGHQRFEEIRKRHARQAGESGAPLSVTALAIKIIAAALRKFPQFNVSLDMAAEEIVVKKYVHIGVAVDTDRGLLVPVIRDADKK